MSLVMVMVIVIISLFIPAVRPSQDLWRLECLPTVGIVAETTVINCNFKDIQEIKIEGVSLKKITENKPLFTFFEETNSGDPRFGLKNPALGPSLQISDTKFSDEGEYLYYVLTDTGEKKVQLRITITAKYKNPISSTWPKDVTDGGTVDLYCNATDGYPAGFIHWFDRSGTNWTMNSDLTKATNDTNGLKSVALSSKLTFKSINLNLGPFRCIVLNSKYVQDGESTLQITSARDGSDKESSITSNTTHIVAGVMVIGSLIVGLLCALLIFRKKNVQRYESGSTAEGDLESDNTP
ncbi:uncharacterized protein LOC143706760 isoform X2 [Siphateles boraxobius]|uniref:uncharacterized protein LOC143706760 isoform X2 n=1 Tax=Siphateles boraxobius TaxID=180520 RepID=UPI004063A16A